MAERAGRKCPELIQPEVNKYSWYLWKWFCELSQGRQNNGMTQVPISWTDLKAWADMMNRSPNEWEVSTIRAIETEYLYG